MFLPTWPLLLAEHHAPDGNLAQETGLTQSSALPATTLSTVVGYGLVFLKRSTSKALDQDLEKTDRSHEWGAWLLHNRMH
tara:strand:- start:298 stop:537 length:240 start_codon:yes stop_codon:yes gene_type:complete